MARTVPGFVAAGGTWGLARWVASFACAACLNQRPVAQAPVEAHGAGRVAPVAATAVRYALPTCPLHYEVLVREKSSLDGAPQFDTERFMSIEATAENGRMKLVAVVVGRAIHGGVRSYGKPSTEYAPPLLETDGLSWTEREGPTWLFSDVGAPGGLAWFFPTLPAAADRDASVVWNVPYASGQSTAALRVEATRGGFSSLKAEVARREASGDARDIPTVFTPAEVRFLESHVEQGTGVSTFGMTAERRDASQPGDVLTYTAVRTCRGTYAVTSSGRILFAHLEASRKTTTGSAAAGTPVQHDVEDADAKMHLVRACDGPVEPSLEPKLTPEEQAMPREDGPRIELPPPAPAKKTP